MNELLTILRELHPDIDFETATGLVEDSVLTSLDIVTIVTEVADRLDVNPPRKFCRKTLIPPPPSGS